MGGGARRPGSRLRDGGRIVGPYTILHNRSGREGHLIEVFVSSSSSKSNLKIKINKNKSLRELSMDNDWDLADNLTHDQIMLCLHFRKAKC